MMAFQNLPLRTKRLLLRPLTANDAPPLLEIFSDPVVMRYWSTLPWTEMAQAEAMIARDASGHQTGEHLRLGIELAATGQLIGTCTLFGINTESRRAELGYGLRASAWGQGYMAEALPALVHYGFESLNLNRIEADIDPRNLASQRSLERLGFTKEGTLRERWIVGDEVSDTAFYGLLRRDWAAQTFSAPQS